MTELQTGLLRPRDLTTPLRIAESAFVADGSVLGLSDFYDWFRTRTELDVARVTRIPFDRLRQWSFHPDTGDVVHDSGRFFAVQGLEVRFPGGPVPVWAQPIINQPEMGILGILVKEFNGVLHCLMQAKNEPGNRNGVQLSPTVQATKSNYSRVHQGKAVPYLEYFRDTSGHHVIADVLQSEQGAWFFQKRNRNMVVETRDDVEVLDGFCWLTIGQMHRLLADEDLINMDSRTVMSCLPFSAADLPGAFSRDEDDFQTAVLRSCSEEYGSLHATGDILSWITEARTLHGVETSRIPLDEVRDWTRTDDAVSHRSGLFFDVIAVDVEVGHREVSAWTQPMIDPGGLGVVAFLVKRIGGVLHVLTHARVEPGYLDVVELAPTVQCSPRNLPALPAEARPLFLDEVLSAGPDRIRFDAVLSEEGGRFYHAQNRYLVVEVDDDFGLDVPPDFRWVALHQLVGLLRHSHYLNVQARSLVACLHSLTSSPA
ncbi:NDP-hexose 2,3-dehydratase family protein [Saccharothrix deserti]|uniref:NDP-hexose 2,3-dehydratase family protein n=1 Tax=Saccharothrix deserti TaxID=2593674 RepID=UPI001EE44C97|nr:NDP-hexose 2,3-dehydratase family protein [Saccharothrix deserti]